MNIGWIDHCAHNGDSFLHRMPAGYKLLCVAALLATLISSKHMATVAALFAGLLVPALALRSHIRMLALLGAYPAAFTLLLAAGGGFASLQDFFLIFGKILACTLLAVLLILTTPYPALMGSLGRIFPSGLQQNLLLLYRSIFISLATLQRIIGTLRLRNTTKRWRPMHQLHCLANVLGLLFVRGSDLSERYGQLLQLRGYDGRALRYSTRRPDAISARLSKLLAGCSILLLFAVQWWDL